MEHAKKSDARISELAAKLHGQGEQEPALAAAPQADAPGVLDSMRDQIMGTIRETVDEQVGDIRIEVANELGRKHDEFERKTKAEVKKQGEASSADAGRGSQISALIPARHRFFRTSEEPPVT